MVIVLVLASSKEVKATRGGAQGHAKGHGSPQCLRRETGRHCPAELSSTCCLLPEGQELSVLVADAFSSVLP